MVLLAATLVIPGSRSLHSAKSVQVTVTTMLTPALMTKTIRMMKSWKKKLSLSQIKLPVNSMARRARRQPVTAQARS